MLNVLAILNLIMLCIVCISGLLALLNWRRIIKHFFVKFGKIMLTDYYQENIMELMPGMRHIGFQNIIENNLRAQSGKMIYRPLISSYRKWPHLDTITFLPAQTSPFPTDVEEGIDVEVTIGPKAKKPLKLKIPLLISAMGYGVGLSEQMRVALAKAAKKTGTAINSGEGGVTQEELEAAGSYILQFSRTPWSKEEELIKQVDAIEIKLGQGAMLGMGKRIPPKDLTGRARDIMGLKEGEDAVIYEQFFENQSLKDIKSLVDELRQFTGGVPIGAKIGTGGWLEDDLDHLIEIGVDYIALDGGQAGMKEAPPILADDFGIPILHALIRAVTHLEARGVRDQISLIAAGGLLVPGHFLKALALGADAVYIGTAMLFAVAHTQSLKALPFEPPTQVAWYSGKLKDQFNSDQGADAAEKFLKSSMLEIELALRAMGKRSLRELCKKDLVSYDETTAELVGIPFTFQPWEEPATNEEQQSLQTQQDEIPE